MAPMRRDLAKQLAQHVLGRVAVGIDSDDPTERFAAAVCLSRVRYGPGESDLREVAGTLLAGLGETCLDLVVPHLGQDDDDVRALAVETIRSLGARAVEVIEDVGSHLDLHPLDVTRALICIGEDSTPVLARALSTGRRAVKLEVLRAMGSQWPTLRDSRLVDCLLDTLQSPDAELRDLADLALDSAAACHQSVVRYLEYRVRDLDPVIEEAVRRLCEEYGDSHVDEA